MALRGKAAVANARLAYEAYEEVFASDRWQALAADGRQHAAPAVGLDRRSRTPTYPTRCTSTELVAPTPSTRCPRRRSTPSPTTARSPATRCTGHYDEAQQVIDELERLGIAYDDVVEVLEDEGVEKFEKSWHELLDTVSRRARRRPSEVRPAGRRHGRPTDGARLPTSRRSPRRGAARRRQVASRLAAKDATLWGPDAEPEASIRLGWVDLPESSRPLLAEIDALRAELPAEGLDRVVLCGMGGSSLAPEVICAHRRRAARRSSTRPTRTSSAALSTATWQRTVVVVSSKSGGTVETDSQRRAFVKAFTDAGHRRRAQRIVVVTDPGSPLEKLATDGGLPQGLPRRPRRRRPLLAR